MSVAILAPSSVSVHAAQTFTITPTRSSLPCPSQKQRGLADAMLHPHILHQVLTHVPVQSLAPLMRVNKQFYQVASRIVYRSVSYFPDRRGPTAFDGIDTVEEPVRNPLTGYVRTRHNLKRDCLRHAKHMHLGYHHHHDPSAAVAPPINGIRPPNNITKPIHNLQLAALRHLHVTGERFCTHRSCPFLRNAAPTSVTVVKIDLFSGSPRWKNAFELPTAATAKRAIYLCQSPFFLRKATMQGLSPVSSSVPSSTFIFALRAHEVEWRDTCRGMSDRDAHSALVQHLSTLAMSPGGIINIVGTELVACHLRPDEVLLSTRPEDIVEAFHDVVAARVAQRWYDEGHGGSLADQLAKVRFWTLREYAEKELREEEVSRESVEQWANCFEHVVASSGLTPA